jgi:hypothetical protein
LYYSLDNSLLEVHCTEPYKSLNIKIRLSECLQD